ncbi:MAG: Tn3 family transposase [Solirubrobacteraceae bacterium]|jgi:hypothetical protein
MSPSPADTPQPGPPADPAGELPAVRLVNPTLATNDRRSLPTSALDMTTVLRQLAAEGWEITPAAVAALSPYIRERIKRFGEYATDGLIDPPDAFDPHLDLLTTATAAQAA